jgi:hypothetical protein
MSASAAAVTDATESATETEEGRYEKAYLATRRSIDECIELLMIKEQQAEQAGDLAERDQVVADRTDLESQRAVLVQAHVAFHAGTATMVPPSAALVAEIVAISTKAVELTVERTTASAILRLATSALNKFAKIQDI